MNENRDDTDLLSAEASEAIDEIGFLYHAKVLQHPCRRVKLTGRRFRKPKIINTLLGFELQIRDKRINCPDLATAEYLKIFAGIGSPEINIPIDPTITADILVDLEACWKRFDAACIKMETGEQQKKAGRLRGRLRDRIISGSSRTEC